MRPPAHAFLCTRREAVRRSFPRTQMAPGKRGEHEYIREGGEEARALNAAPRLLGAQTNAVALHCVAFYTMAKGARVLCVVMRLISFSGNTLHSLLSFPTLSSPRWERMWGELGGGLTEIFPKAGLETVTVMTIKQAREERGVCVYGGRRTSPSRLRWASVIQ